MLGSPIKNRCWPLWFLLWSMLTLPAMAQSVPVNGPMTSPFGWRTDPLNGSGRFHAGIDLAAATGTPVYATQSGMVAFSGPYGGYGNVVVLDHGRSLYTLYGHNSQLLVRQGDTVYAGQAISLAGSTGRATGPHLHFEVHSNGQYVNPVAYLSWLRDNGAMIAQAPAVQQAVPVPQPATEAPVPQGGQSEGRGRSGRVVQLLNGTHLETVAF